MKPTSKNRMVTALDTEIIIPDCATSKYTDPTGTAVLRVDEGCDLDTYTFGEQGPIDFDIFVDRYAGPVTAEGYPAAGHAFADRIALITLRVFDVDDDYIGSWVREIDQLLVNGHEIAAPSYGVLTGANGQWSTVSFQIDAATLKFPAAPGEVAVNEFQLNIDLGNLEPGDEPWAVTVDWAELRLSSDVLPVALLHGITGTGARMADMKAFYEENVWQLGGKIIAPSLTTNGSTYTNELLLRDHIAELKQVTGAEQVNLVAHSMGGLTSRRYAWLHPGEVRNVVMVATPNGGSPVADHICEVRNNPLASSAAYYLVILLGSEAMGFGDCTGPGDGLYQLQTSYMRDVFNKSVRDHTSGTGYATIAGTGLGALSPVIFEPSDGLAPLESVRWMAPDGPGAGVHQSLEPIFDLNHDELIARGSGAIPRSLCHAYVAQYSCTSAGPSPAAATMAGTAQAAPAELAATAGTMVPPGGSAQLPLTLETADDAQLVILTEAGVTGSYKGTPLQATQIFGAPALMLSTTGGSGTLTLHNAGSQEAAAVAMGSVSTSRRLAVAGPTELPTAGSPVSAAISLTEATAGEQVSYRVLDGAGTELTTGLATSTGTGNYTATFTPARAGVYSVVAWTAGARPRTASAVVPIGANDGRNIGTGATWLTPDVNSDGRSDALEVSVPVNAPAGGKFEVAGDLIGPGGQVIASAGDAVTVSAGSGWATLRFEGQAIFGAGLDGPYTLGNLILSDEGQNLLDHVTVQATSGSYTAVQFDHYDVDLNLQGFTDELVDADSNRYAEQLLVHGGVRVDFGGSYAINARLVGPNGQEIAKHQQTASLVAGQNQFTMTFPWSTITASGIDGPYTVVDLSVYPIFDAGNGAFLPSAHTTEPYLASGLINQVPLIHVEPVTLEGNTTGGYTGSLPGASAEDPDGDTVTLTNDSSMPLPLGLHNIAWTATDSHGAASTTVQSATVRDTTVPTITCPAAVTSSSATPALGSPAVSDIVDSTLTVTSNAPAPFPPGVTTVTWQARDDSGNLATCQQPVTVSTAYAFDGFYNGSTYIASYHTVVTGPARLNLEFGLKTADGTVLTDLNLIASYRWDYGGGSAGTLTFNAATGRFHIPISTNKISTISKFTVLLRDGTSHTLTVECEAV